MAAGARSRSMDAERAAGTEMEGRSESLAQLLGHFRRGPAGV